jgi:hypothetical protein
MATSQSRHKLTHYQEYKMRTSLLLQQFPEQRMAKVYELSGPSEALCMDLSSLACKLLYGEFSQVPSWYDALRQARLGYYKSIAAQPFLPYGSCNCSAHILVSIKPALVLRAEGIQRLRQTFSSEQPEKIVSQKNCTAVSVLAVMAILLSFCLFASGATAVLG